MRHDRLCAPSEQRQEVVDQFSLRKFAGNSCFKDMEVPHLPHAAPCLFTFPPINQRLKSSRKLTLFFGKCLLNFADLRSALLPQNLHNLEFHL